MQGDYENGDDHERGQNQRHEEVDGVSRICERCVGFHARALCCNICRGAGRARRSRSMLFVHLSEGVPLHPPVRAAAFKKLVSSYRYRQMCFAFSQSFVPIPRSAIRVSSENEKTKKCPTPENMAATESRVYCWSVVVVLTITHACSPGSLLASWACSLIRATMFEGHPWRGSLLSHSAARSHSAGDRPGCGCSGFDTVVAMVDSDLFIELFPCNIRSYST